MGLTNNQIHANNVKAHARHVGQLQLVAYLVNLLSYIITNNAQILALMAHIHQKMYAYNV